ncbi:hypothetical protein PG989_010439 [Apiospora arundinis]
MGWTPVDIDSNKEAIIRLCSYHRDDFSRLLVHSSPQEMEAVQESLRTAFSTPPIASLASFDNLPAEVLIMILSDLDIMSYFRFRQVNRGARLLATGLTKEYLAVATHGLEGLRGLLRGNLDHRFTIPDLYRTLVTRDCALCGDFGGFLYLPSNTRCCYRCIHVSADLALLSTTSFCRFAKVTPSEAEPHILGAAIRTVPGHYSTEDTPAKRTQYLVSVRDGLDALASRGVARPAWRKYPIHDSDGTPIEQRRMACTTLPWYDPDTSQAEGGVCCKGCLSRNNSRSLEWSASVCKNRMFSSEGFLAHFEECWYAKHLWAHTSGHCGLVYTCNSKLCTTHSKFHI